MPEDLDPKLSRGLDQLASGEALTFPNEIEFFWKDFSRVRDLM